MSISEAVRDFVVEYWEGKKYRCGEEKDEVWYSYASHVGKYSRSNILDQILVAEFSPIEVYLWTAMMSTVKQSRDYIKSGVIFLTYPDFQEVCSDRVFVETKRKFVEFELLIPTPHKKWFIINPLHTSKYYKIVEKKER